jgi:uncharacterized membrane protein YgaE (UPF0421/DUF939 family)
MEKNMDEILGKIDSLIEKFGDKKVIRTRDVMHFYSLLENNVDASLEQVENVLINKMKENEENKEMIKNLLDKLNKTKGE